MKKFLASLLGVVMFFLLVPTCTLIITREIMSEKTIRAVIEIVPEIIEDKTVEGSKQSIAETFIQDIEGVDPKLAEYYDDEELVDELAKMFASVLENLGNPESEYLIDTTSFKEYLKQGIKEYEKDTGTEIGVEIIDIAFEEINNEVNITREELGLENYAFIFEMIFSNNLLITLVAGIVLCIILIYILLGKIQEALLKVKTPFLVNGIGALIIGTGLRNIILGIKVGGDYPLDKISSIISFPFFKVAFASIFIGILLIIIAKILKHNRSIENSNAALENLGNVNYIPNNNISNTPYNGYQNH